MTETKPALASENCHYYTKEGAPCYEVEAKNGQMRPTTLRDARKLSLVPISDHDSSLCSTTGVRGMEGTNATRSGVDVAEAAG